MTDPNGRLPSLDPETVRAQNRAFWEARGHAPARTAFSATLMSEHRRYNAYIHAAEVAYLERVLPLSPSLRVMDLGCGEGRLTLALAPRVGRAVGFDLSTSLVARATEEARRQGLENTHFEARALGEPFGAERFDVVLLSGVLNYLDDAAAQGALERASEALVPGGLLFLRNNCANGRAFFRPAEASHAPTFHRTGTDYVALVASRPELELLEERFLFAPLVAPNLVYYHVLPKALRDARPVNALLDAWFALERATSEARLRILGPVYGTLLRLLRKPTSFRVLLACRR